MTKLTTLQKRYGTHQTKPTHRDLITLAVRWQRLFASPTIRQEIDRSMAGLGYQGAFRECLELTEMMVESDKARMECVQPVKDSPGISTVDAIHLATRMDLDNAKE